MYIHVNGKKINYEVYGQGKPLIFVHGWGGTIESLHKLAQLASTEYKTIILDLPGFGTSENPESNWGVEEYANFILAFMDALKIDTFYYCGHSFGGSLGIYISSHVPNRVEKLILCGSAFKRTQKKSSTVSFFKSQLEKIPFLRSLEKLLKIIVYKVFFPQSDLLKFPHLESNFRLIMTQDLTPETTNITQPTLLLWGEQDTYTPLSYADELHANIKHSVLKTYPDKRHNLPIKYPEIVWKEMQPFLAKK